MRNKKRVRDPFSIMRMGLFETISQFHHKTSSSKREEEAYKKGETKRRPLTTKSSKIYVLFWSIESEKSENFEVKGFFGH